MFSLPLPTSATKSAASVLERIFFHDILNTAGGMLGVAEVLRTGTAEDVEEFKDAVALLANSLVDEIKAQQILLPPSVANWQCSPNASTR